jgi:hypothetical protein
MRREVATWALGLALTAAAAGAEGPYDWKPFAAVAWVSPIDETDARVGGEVRAVELSDELGWEAGVEWRFGRVWGIEASYARSEHEVEFGGGRLGEVTLEPVYLAVNLHFGDWERLDAWAAPTAVFARWSEPRLERGVEARSSSETTLGAAFGIDWQLDEVWALTALVRYFDVQLELGGGEVAVDPIVLRVGVAARL